MREKKIHFKTWVKCHAVANLHCHCRQKTCICFSCALSFLASHCTCVVVRFSFICTCRRKRFDKNTTWWFWSVSHMNNITSVLQTFGQTDKQISLPRQGHLFSLVISTKNTKQECFAQVGQTHPTTKLLLRIGSSTSVGCSSSSMAAV